MENSQMIMTWPSGPSWAKQGKSSWRGRVIWGRGRSKITVRHGTLAVTIHQGGAAGALSGLFSGLYQGKYELSTSVLHLFCVKALLFYYRWRRKNSVFSTRNSVKRHIFMIYINYFQLYPIIFFEKFHIRANISCSYPYIEHAAWMGCYIPWWTANTRRKGV